MSKPPELRETIPPPDEVIQAGLDGDLVLFIGAGVSRLVGLPDWRGLAALALEDLRKESLLNFSEIDQLRTQDPKKQLSIAKLIAEENGCDFNIAKHLAVKPKDGTVYDAINQIGCPCVTTNYDELLSPQYCRTEDGSETAVPINRVSARDQFFATLLSEPGAVVHLHGCLSRPETMVVTMQDYLEHYDHENVQEFLRELFTRKTIVFLGYGLEEAEILEHILRRARVKETGDRRRFFIQGFFISQKPLYEKLYHYYEKSFGVRLLGFIRDHEDYRALESTIRSWASSIEIREPPLLADLEVIDEVLGNG